MADEVNKDPIETGDQDVICGKCKTTVLQIVKEAELCEEGIVNGPLLKYIRWVERFKGNWMLVTVPGSKGGSFKLGWCECSGHGVTKPEDFEEGNPCLVGHKDFQFEENGPVISCVVRVYHNAEESIQSYSLYESFENQKLILKKPTPIEL